MSVERPSRPPSVSVVIPAYDSHGTVGRCLDALSSQTWRDFEVIVVDSSQDDRTADLLETEYRWVRYVHSARRLLPHAARNRGVALATGRLIVFLDPDVYARPTCLERLVAAHVASGGVIVGSLACHGRRWLDVGIHLCKFGAWLPGGRPRATHMAPTANMLVSRDAFGAAGGIPDADMLGDIDFSRRLLALGHRLHFQPDAVVAHHHEQDVRQFVRERYTRGQTYGDLRLAWYDGRPITLGLLVATTIVPVRLPRVMVLGAWQALRAGLLGSYVATFPLVLVGHLAAIAGEAVAYGRFCLHHPIAHPARR